MRVRGVSTHRHNIAGLPLGEHESDQECDLGQSAILVIFLSKMSRRSFRQLCRGTVGLIGFWKVAWHRHNQLCGVATIGFAVDDFSQRGPSLPCGQQCTLEVSTLAILVVHLVEFRRAMPQKAGRISSHYYRGWKTQY